MLFALTIGQVAIYITWLWRVYSDDGASYQLFAALAHLLLASFVVTTSWVGWSRSVAPGTQVPVKRIFELTRLDQVFDIYPDFTEAVRHFEAR
ncbi:MAG: hypothetical protein IH956_10065 [Chloroflexi bacterium]|nr:hypothetical protein [Chloroflexota bacterium]